MDNDLNYAMGALNSSIQSMASTIGAANLDRTNRKFAQEEAEKQRAWNEEMWNKTNAWNYEMWKETNAYNSPTEQVNRLRDAGLNPLFYGLDGSSANAFQASQPLGYERADYASTINPAQVGAEVYNQSIAVAKDLQLKNAQIDKLQEDTKSVSLDNEWKDRTMAARTESEQLKNEALRGDIKIKEQDLKNKAQELEKLIAETKNEDAKYGYILAQTAVQNALESKTREETASIIALRPYEIALKQAQTDAQKAAAAASYASAAINNGLLKAGYVEQMLDKLIAETEASKAIKESTEVQRMFNEYRLALRNGTVFDTGQPVGKGEQFVHDVLGKFFQMIAITGDALGGLSGAAGAAAGAAAGSASGSQPAPHKSVSFGSAMGQ